MKRLFCLFLTLTLLLCACAPDGKTDPTEDTGTETALPSQTSPATEPTEETLPQTDALDDLRNNLPTMDGSTSLIPLEAGIRAALFGKTIEEATLDVSHSSTWGSYWKLLSGRVDLIFSCPLSQEQWDTAEEQGVELETVPVAMEGFVFVVNAENPVDTLTQEQLRDIYSGEITNWSEVGGLDEEIIPYQRNNDSGSQNYMTEFMGDTPLMDAPTEMRPTSMSGLMDVIAINDNARGAIGYSVYAYAADMYGNGNEIKFIQVDGVAPSKATMAAGEYPLMGKNYAVFNASQPEDGYVRQLVDWICSYDGQLALAQAGYVTLQDIGFDYEEMTLSKYQGMGTGTVAGEADPFEYVLLTNRPNEYASENWYNEYWGVSMLLDENMMTYQVPSLADETLQAEIQDFVDTQIRQWAWEQAEATKQLILKNNETASPASSFGSVYGWNFRSVQSDMPLCVGFSCTNGYLSAAVTVAYGMNITECYKRTETATWDLLTGERLQPEDLFSQGVDVDHVLNAYIKDQMQGYYDGMYEWNAADPMKREFAGLTTTGWHLTHDAIFIDQANPYFAYGACISLNRLPQGTMVSQNKRDFSQILADENLRCICRIRRFPVDAYYEFGKDGVLDCAYLPEDQYVHGAQINETVRDYVNTWFYEEKIREFIEDQGYDSENVHLGWEYNSVYPTNLADRYVIFTGPDPSMIVDGPDGSAQTLYYPHCPCLIFDLQTGEQLQWQDLLLPGWEETGILETFSGETAPEGLTTDDLWLLRIVTHTNDQHLLLSFCCPEDGQVYRLRVPYDWVNL